LIKCVLICALVALSISLTSTEGSAASNRLDKVRCPYANCFTLPLPKRYGYSYRGRTTDSEKLRRKRVMDDAVSRLQEKIAREQAKRRSTSEKERNPYSYSTIDRLYADSPFRELTCREGRLLVQGQGFFRVNPLECRGRTFTYLARENGRMVRVTVDSLYGRIISTRPF
jgi:hypothetical protein